MKKKFWRIVAIAVSCGVVSYGQIWHIGLFQLHAQSDSQQQQILHPPYYGNTGVNAVFDHEFPVYTDEIDEEYLECANTLDPHVIPTTIVHNDGTRSTTLLYSGHDGIDFGLRYDYVLAAHNGTVTEAGWSNPQNRRAGLGLRIELRTADQIHRTSYGHMSTLLNRQSDVVNQEQVIGISGNTGYSTGPHLHFTVRVNGVVVNPYGWANNGTDVPDPWHCVNSTTPNQSLWAILPNITSDVYPNGPGLPYPLEPKPPLRPNFNYPNLIVDDLNPRFLVYGVPWTMQECDDWFGACFGTTYFTNGEPATSDYAIWQLLDDDLLGFYDVYAFIPRDNANSSLAYYEIRHTGQVLSAGIDQSRFNQTIVSNPWAYLGRYNFSQMGTAQLQQAVRVYHTLQGDDSRVSLGADALVFVMADGSPDLILPISQGSNDAGPNPISNCNFDIGFPEIYLGHCNNGTAIVSGFRYNNVGIPAGATIIRAHLEFVVDGTYIVPLQLRFFGDNNPASPPFSSGNRPQDRSLTAAWVNWSIPAADQWLISTKRVSPNLASIVQELVDHPGWTQGESSLTFIVRPAPNFSGNAHRRVMAYERDQPPPPPPGQYAARLLVWYEE